ncbi:hypothetical protein ACXR8U_13955 [Methylobacterium radiotolerans]|jgi:hypothetical protein|uniref:hypothetical protein n=1 Tax=Methylobacterium TaxID=407 RepID=UPI0005E82773|nr:MULTISPECIES: hypothetical protein [Methylobacterium]MBN6821719.1 hypothetical protein [Methylobacterium organophilum]OXE40289.1 hypothetical protein CCS92_19835 [Methylobacterium radiotolerans]GAN49667.1 hypothetical protein ME121_3698 [Methylobacterium sp. ME121]
MQTIQLSAARAPIQATRLTSLLEAARDPLSRARTNLSIAEADLNGLIARYSASRSALDATAICWAQIRVNEARHTLDRLRSLAIVVIGDAANAEAC